MRRAVQLYTVRDLPDDLPTVLEAVADAGYEGVEFATRIGEADLDAVAATLDRTGLEAAGIHVGLEDLESERADLLAIVEALAIDDVVLSWLDPEHFADAAAVAETAALLSGIDDDLAAEGLTFHYHNHDQEFVDTEDGVAFHLLARDAPEINFEVDAGWALAGGADPVALLDRYGDRITHVHAKDVTVDGDLSPPFGEGDLPIGDVVDAARAIDAAWLVYEDDEPADPQAALERGAAVLAEHW